MSGIAHLKERIVRAERQVKRLLDRLTVRWLLAFAGACGTELASRAH